MECAEVFLALGGADGADRAGGCAGTDGGVGAAGPGAGPGCGATPIPHNRAWNPRTVCGRCSGARDSASLRA
ncbi:hypothetical protein, partial [uncultured Lamprocystis sp.]|uniref:hypothetical protein n=1 Tax=uncultured Lamprocystis sp. TaxID=543132 RepID=UPI0025D06681